MCTSVCWSSSFNIFTSSCITMSNSEKQCIVWWRNKYNVLCNCGSWQEGDRGLFYVKMRTTGFFVSSQCVRQISVLQKSKYLILYGVRQSIILLWYIFIKKNWPHWEIRTSYQLLSEKKSHITTRFTKHEWKRNSNHHQTFKVIADGNTSESSDISSYACIFDVQGCSMVVHIQHA